MVTMFLNIMATLVIFTWFITGITGNSPNLIKPWYDPVGIEEEQVKEYYPYEEEIKEKKNLNYMM